MPPARARFAPPLDPSLPEEELESWRALHDLAYRKTAGIPEAVLCAHVLRVTRGGDFPVQRAAMEAILRRIDGARREGLRIAARPPRGQALGSYRTQRKGRDARPYETQLLSVDPPLGRCGCPD